MTMTTTSQIRRRTTICSSMMTPGRVGQEEQEEQTIQMQ